MGLNGFNRIAGAYDLLARLVFGRTIEDSQRQFLSYIRPKSNVLIVGGGTGKIIQHLLREIPDVHITFIDASLAMLDRARKRTPSTSRVRLIHGTEENIPGEMFDAVITPFYLDMFPEGLLIAAIEKISGRLHSGAQWLVADFTANRLWHRCMLGTMYIFFRITAGIEARRLPDYEGALQAAGWTKMETETFYARFIQASRWLRKS